MRIVYIAMALAAVLLTGCKAPEMLAGGIAEKSLSGSGTFIHSKVGVDTVTHAPELSGLFVWGDYTSVTGGDEIFRFEETEDASIFNAESKTKKKKIFFATGDKSRMDKVLQTYAK